MPWSVLLNRRPEERLESKAEGELRLQGATPCFVLFPLSLVGKSITSLNRPFQAKVGSLWRSQLFPCNFGTHLIRAAPASPQIRWDVVASRKGSTCMDLFNVLNDMKLA